MFARRPCRGYLSRAPLAGALIVILAAVAFHGTTEAARDIETVAVAGTSSAELVVLEAEGCIYCRIFRRDVLPSYETSPRARDVPIRFVDISSVDPMELGLAGPIEIAPTIVLLRNGREAGRITGYVGPEIFFHSVNRLLSGAD